MDKGGEGGGNNRSKVAKSKMPVLEGKFVEKEKEGCWREIEGCVLNLGARSI